MNKLLLLFLLFFHFAIVAQNQESVYKEIEKSISEGNILFHHIDTSFTSNELVNTTITQEKDINNSENDIYFVNNKYYITITSSGKKTLGTYKFKVLHKIPVIILFGRSGAQDTNYKALVVKQNNNKYKVDWNHNKNYTYTQIRKARKDSLILIDNEIVSDINYHNPNISFDLLNAKIGVTLNGKKIIDNVCDSLKINGGIAAVFNSGQTSLYNLKGKLLCKNIKSFYPYSTIYHQIIDTKNEMYFIDTLGSKYDKPTKQRTIWGNDSDSNTNTTYYAYKNKILKVKHKSFSLSKYTELSRKKLDIFDNSSQSIMTMSMLEDDFKNINQDKKYLKLKEIENLVRKKRIEDLFLLKKVFKADKYREKLSYYLLSDITTTTIQLPKEFKKIRFVNNKTTEISAEDYWYYNGFYKPLKPSYIIVKKKKLFGVWDIKEENTILFNYKNITPKKGTHLLLEKNNLVTYYPYIGLTSKYEYLSNYIEYYARFKYPNGKKGWVSRKGIEYYD
ncbi:hypothetical protein KLA_11575 [Cellulophaga geojensis KL-A]|uniref:Uncharacterized protein n=1 Tax=Cellulophaga geojensis KL-A TaxID=1328323 RepID=A0ABP3B7Y7_9FLAO|nr:hypothetical protein [Cellulophaga geojensis]EWH12972.1 hypothetical protein KLA_11575 [Cellulophaga geojensis KL-A]